jgi:hypothetical protein
MNTIKQKTSKYKESKREDIRARSKAEFYEIRKHFNTKSMLEKSTLEDQIQAFYLSVLSV